MPDAAAEPDDFTPVDRFLGSYVPEPALETPEAAFHPVLSMTAGEVAAECERLRSQLGGRAHVSASVCAPFAIGMVTIGVYPYGIAKGGHQHFWGPNWPEAFRRAREWVESTAVARDTGAIA